MIAHRYESYSLFGDLFDHLYYQHGVSLERLREMDYEHLAMLHQGCHA